MNKKCTKCNTENPLHAKYCRRCGNSFDDVPEIVDFYVESSKEINSLLLKWEIRNADKVMLNGHDVTKLTQKPCKINRDMSFELEACNGTTKTSKVIFVHYSEFTNGPIKKSKPSIGDVFYRNIFSLLLLLFSTVFLVLINFYGGFIRYNLHLGYSVWQDISKVANMGCWLLLCMSAVWLILSIIKSFNKKRLI